MEKGRCPILEFQMQNGEQLGTDPPPNLAKKKKRKKVRLQKKINLSKAKPFSAKKTAEPKQGYTKHVTDTHTHKKKSSHKVSNRKVEYQKQ